ncbi:uncharacterized protein LOC127285791 [Leptopilina boulardi]|uniref:uncharacterized protein LOC127285791 n=1 Tax=Leptopilina boulardi TaxID=63433 RepID=UPI0021F5FA6A|nr:uncharacterized protein LOC127285791 [Leptopilina boulardi]
MMEHISVSFPDSLNFQFLSVCHYITTLGIIFYNKKLITSNQQSQTISVLNTLFEYLKDSNNESETKLELLQTILKGSDLYGGGENDMLDALYVDNTYKYIIRTALFSHYGNLNKYLARIIIRANDTSYSNVIKFIKQEHHFNYISMDYCLNRKKSPKLKYLSVKKVYFDYILPLFPEPDDKNMNIMHVDYIYAMAGLEMVKSILKETVYASFSDYVNIARVFHLQKKNKKETYEIQLVIFLAPALFFSAYNEKETYRKINQNSLTEKFLIMAYENLFSHIALSLDNKQIIETAYLLKVIHIGYPLIRDPNFDLTFFLSKFSSKILYKIYYAMLERIQNNSSNQNLQLLLTSMLKKLKTNMKLSTTFNGLKRRVLLEENHYKLVQYYYPGGENFFGPTCLSSNGNIAQLRTIEGNKYPLPVFPIHYEANKIYYREYNPATNTFSNDPLEMGENDILRKMIHFNLTDTNIKTNYQVNPNTIKSHEPPIKKMKPNPSENFNIEEQNLALDVIPETHRQLNIRGSLASDDIPSTSKGSKQVFTREGLTNNDFRETKYLSLPVENNISGISESNLRDNAPGTPSGSKLRKEGDDDTETSKAVFFKDNNNNNHGQLSDDNLYYMHMFGEEYYNECVKALQQFKQKGLFEIKEDKELLLKIRLTLEYLTTLQSNRNHLGRRELWFRQTLSNNYNIHRILYLKNKDFHFNDITLLNDISLEIKPTKVLETDSMIKILYRINADFQYGLVDLGAFHYSFLNQYIIYPEVNFIITHVKNTNEGEFCLYITQKEIEKDEWFKIRQEELMSLKNEEMIQNKRSEIIESAAYDISSNLILHSFKEWKENLKQYVLGISMIQNNVPTYAMFVEDLKSFSSLQKYQFFKINNIFVKDLLYKKLLYKVNDLESARQIIANTFDGVIRHDVESVFLMYHSLGDIENQILFEDYYVIYSSLNDFVSNVERFEPRFEVALYRLALRQCTEELMINQPVTLYVAMNFRKSSLHPTLSQRSRIIYKDRENALQNVPSTDTDEELVLFQIKMNSQVGIADIGRIIENKKGLYFLTSGIYLKKFERTFRETINGKKVRIWPLNSVDTEKEILTVQLVYKINELQSSITTS